MIRPEIFPKIFFKVGLFAKRLFDDYKIILRTVNPDKIFFWIST